MVRGKNQLDRGLSGCADRSCVGENLQALFYRIGAGRGETASSFDLNYADAAGADAVDILQIAERRDLDVDRFSCLKDCGALRDSNGDIINL